MRSAVMIVVGCLGAFSVAASPCDDKEQRLALGINQIDCKVGARLPAQNEEYLALSFRFNLAADLAAGKAVNSIRGLFDWARQSDSSFIVSIAPEVGGVTLPAQTLFTYDLTKNGTHAASNITEEFFTPYVISDGSPLKFTVTVNQSSALSLKFADIAADVVKPVGLGAPASLVLSEAGKEVVEAAAALADRMANRLFATSNRGSATLQMGHEQRSGAVRRVLELKLLGPDDRSIKIGTLTAIVAMKPSLASAFNWVYADGEDIPELPRPSDGDNLLQLTLPAQVDKGQSLLSALRGENDTFMHIRRLLSAAAGDSLLVDACSGLRTALMTEYGFTADDSIRAVAALLKRDGRNEPLRVNSKACFATADWPRIVERRLFEPQVLPTDWAQKEGALLYLATGMREGFSPELGRVLAERVEVELPPELRQELGCGGIMEKTVATACLTRIGLNRHDAPAPHLENGEDWAEFHLSRRHDIEKAFSDLRGAPLPSDQAEAEKVLANPENSRRVADSIAQFYQAEVELDTTGTPVKVRRVKIVPISRTELAEHVMSLGEIRELGNSCWAPGNASGGWNYCWGKVKPSVSSSS